MRDEVASLREQLRWSPPPVEPARARRVLTAAMGGSAMAADAAALAFTDLDVTTHRGYDLPPWLDPDDGLVVAVSYSGNTEETLSTVGGAIDRGVAVAGVTSGGKLAELGEEHGFPVVIVPDGRQPRAAIGYQLVATTAILAAVAGRSAEAAVTEAATVTEARLSPGSAPGLLAADLADALERRLPVIMGVQGPAAVAARRWKTQINENAKRAAYSVDLPEADHNELEAWGDVMEPDTVVGLVLLRDDADDRLKRRSDLTREFLGESCVGEVRADGGGPLARFMSLVVVGDLVSVELAERRGVDPTPVERLEEFKRRMREG